MGKILVIGVTCVDVVINVDRLPKTAEDVVVYGQRMTLGGCAFNAFAVMHALGEPAILFSPIGQGAYGDFVREHLAAEGISSPIDDAPGENGCCYCFVEPGGERTFLAYHGAEYVHRTAWFDQVDADDVDMVYGLGPGYLRDAAIRRETLWTKMPSRSSCTPPTRCPSTRCSRHASVVPFPTCGYAFRRRRFRSIAGLAGGCSPVPRCCVPCASR